MKLGFICLPAPGHLNPMAALARKMQSRGHEVVLIGLLDVEPFARAVGLEFLPICEDQYPAGSAAKLFGPFATLHGPAVMQCWMNGICPAFLENTLADLPAKLCAAGIEGLIADGIYPYAELAAMSLDLPCVTAWLVLNYDGSGTTPPCFFEGQFENTPEARARNAKRLAEMRQTYQPAFDVAQAFADRVGLDVKIDDLDSTFSPLAIVSQTPEFFDYPGIPWPPQFHYTGPFSDDAARVAIPFPWEKLADDKPLIYASLGTVVNGLPGIHRTLLQTMGQLRDHQIVFSVGSNVAADTLGSIPENVLVVEMAPQLELLQRAVLCLTHAGLNTTLEALAAGVPLVAIPVAFEQPGVAARLAFHGVGEFIALDGLNEQELAGAMRRVVDQPTYREKARHFQKALAANRGLDTAADVIETAFRAAPASANVLVGAIPNKDHNRRDRKSMELHSNDR